LQNEKQNPSCQILCATIQDGDNIVSADESNKLTQQEVAKPSSRSVITETREVRARQDLKESRKRKNITLLSGFSAQQSKMATTSFLLLNQTN